MRKSTLIRSTIGHYGTWRSPFHLRKVHQSFALAGNPPYVSLIDHSLFFIGLLRVSVVNRRRGNDYDSGDLDMYARTCVRDQLQGSSVYMCVSPLYCIEPLRYARYLLRGFQSVYKSGPMYSIHFEPIFIRNEVFTIASLSGLVTGNHGI